MRTAIIALLLAVTFAQVNVTMSNASTTPTTGGGQQEFKGGCNLRCRQLRFIGEGSVPIKPKWALLDLSVEVNSLQLQGGNMSAGGSGSGGNQSAMAKQVREEAHHRAKFILNYLKDLKMEDLQDVQTQEISFQPMEDDQDQMIGYKATFGLSFKVALAKFQEVLDRIVSESGANRVNSIVFVADPKEEQDANIKAIELAMQDAWKQAQAVTKVFGIQGKLKLLRVREKIQPSKRVLRRLAARRMDDDDDDDNKDFSMLNLLQGDTIVNSRLVLTFDFEDGTINFQNVEPIVNNMTVADTFGDLLKEGDKKPQDTKPNATQPVATTTTTVVLPNNTAAAQPGITIAPAPAEPQPTPANTVP